MRLSKLRRHRKIGLKKAFNKENNEILEEYGESSPQNIDGSATSGKSGNDGPKPFVKALSPADSEGERQKGYISPDKVLLSDKLANKQNVDKSGSRERGLSSNEGLDRNTSRASNHNSIRSRRESMHDAVSDFFYSYSKPSGESPAQTSHKKPPTSD